MIVSAKLLGLLALPGSCPRCLWVRFHAGDALPWQVPPGLFGSIDAYTKRTVHTCRASQGRLPDCLKPFGETATPQPVPQVSRFQRMDPISGVTLRGVPDEILRREDGSLAIVDYKTGRYADGQDKLLPLYLVQLNAYAWIGREQGLHPVRQLGLVYFEPKIEPEGEGWPVRLEDNGFALAFRGVPVRLDLDPDRIIPPLLQQVRHLLGQPRPPRPVNGCQDCQRLDRIMHLVADGTVPLTANPPACSER